MTLTLDNVASVYSGKLNRCCCGCSGKHTDADENPCTVKMIFNKIMKAYYKDVTKISDTCYSLETDTRLYVVYMKGH